MGELSSLPEQYEECQDELYHIKQELTNVQAELEKVQRQSTADQAEIQELSVKLETTTKDLTGKLHAKTEECRISHAKCGTLEIENSKMSTDLTDYKEKTDSLTIENEDLHIQMGNLKEVLFKYNIERKELHNTIMDLRGNIRVFCRVRPPLDSEMDRKMCSWQYYDETSLEICKLTMVSSSSTSIQ